MLGSWLSPRVSLKHHTDCAAREFANIPASAHVQTCMRSLMMWLFLALMIVPCALLACVTRLLRQDARP